MKNYGTWLYHPTEAPSGRRFYNDRDGLEAMEAEGWVDNPSKFPKAGSAAPKKAAKKKVETPRQEDAGSSGTEPVVSDDSGKENAPSEDGGSKDDGAVALEYKGQKVSEMSRPDLVAALREEGVEVDGRTGRDALEEALTFLLTSEADEKTGE